MTTRIARGSERYLRWSHLRRSLRATLLAALISAGAVQAAVPGSLAVANDCDDAIAAANMMNESGDYSGALAAFDAIVAECDGKDERMAIQTGRAHSLNKLGRHDEAIAAANQVLAEDDLHLFALFERATAYEAKGQMELAEADYNLVIRTADTNVHVEERATLYAHVGQMYYSSGKTAEAHEYLNKAIELDPANPTYVIIQGDWATKEGDYAAADQAYSKATGMGVSNAEMYQIRAEGSIKMMQDKYGTTNAQEMRAAMTPQETAMVCADVTKALALGWKNAQMDMFSALVCQ
ncbi:MAG: tetratricopeptide repeat protein [marine benthic group bacterium]|nr:tetratricopeptide repeat protein [Gemmatimonadota bacterium]